MCPGMKIFSAAAEVGEDASFSVSLSVEKGKEKEFSRRDWVFWLSFNLPESPAPMGESGAGIAGEKKARILAEIGERELF